MAPAVAPFNDIAGSAFYDDIVWLVDAGITGLRGPQVLPDQPGVAGTDGELPRARV